MANTPATPSETEDGFAQATRNAGLARLVKKDTDAAYAARVIEEGNLPTEALIDTGADAFKDYIARLEHDAKSVPKGFEHAVSTQAPSPLSSMAAAFVAPVQSGMGALRQLGAGVVGAGWGLIKGSDAGLSLEKKINDKGLTGLAAWLAGSAIGLVASKKKGLSVEGWINSAANSESEWLDQNPGAHMWDVLAPLSFGVTDFTQAIADQYTDEGIHTGAVGHYAHEAADVLGVALEGALGGGGSKIGERGVAAEGEIPGAAEAAPKSPHDVPDDLQSQGHSIDEELDADLREQSSKKGEAAADTQGLRSAVTQAMGPQRASRIHFVHDESGLPGGAAKLGYTIRKGNHLMGLFTKDGDAYVFTGKANTPELAAWTAIHELGGHGGIRALIEAHPDVKVGNIPITQAYENLRASVLDNKTVRDLSSAIGKFRRPDNWEQLSTDQRMAFHRRMGEEAMAELQAAKRTGNWDELTRKYGVNISEGFKQAATSALNTFVSRMKEILNSIHARITGKSTEAFTDQDVHDMLDRMWEASKGESEKEKEDIPETPISPESKLNLATAKGLATMQAGVNQNISDATRVAALSAGWDEAVASDARLQKYLAEHEDLASEEEDEFPGMPPDEERPEPQPPLSPEARFPGIAAAYGAEQAVKAAHVVDHLFDDMDTLDAELPNRKGRPVRARGLNDLLPLSAAADREARAQATMRAMQARQTLGAHWAEQWASLHDWLGSIFPAITRPDVEEATTSIIRNSALSTFEANRVDRVLRDSERRIASFTPEQHRAVWAFMESGTPLPADIADRLDWNSIVAFKDKLGQRLADNESYARGFPPYKVRKNYSPRYGNRDRGIPYDTAGNHKYSEAFEKQKRYPTYEAMIQDGTQAFSPNYFSHWRKRVQMSSRYVKRYTTLRDAMRLGTARIVPDDYEPTPDETVVSTPDHASHLAMPTTLYHALRNSTMQSLWNEPSRFENALGALISLKSATTTAILAFSGFHPFNAGFFVARPDAFLEVIRNMRNPLTPGGVVDFADALSKLVTGPRGGIKLNGKRASAAQIVRAAHGAGAMRLNRAGAVVNLDTDPAWTIVDVARGRQPISAITEPVQEGLRILHVAGADLSPNSEWGNQALGRMLDNFAKHTKSGNLAGVGWSIPAMIRATAAPIMHEYVPWIKVRAFLDSYGHWIRHNTHLRGTPQEQVWAVRRWRELGERMGEMNTSNLMWSHWLTTILQGSLLSFGWDMGLISQFAGGAKDVATAIARKSSGKDVGVLRSRMAYSALYLGYGAGIGFLITKFMGGQDPKSLKDAFYPIAGHDDAGNPIRVSMPWIGRDIAGVTMRSRYEGLPSALAQTLFDKAAPITSQITELSRNANFFNQQIRDPYDPWFTQMGQVWKYLVESNTPITFRNAEQLDPHLAGAAKVLAELSNAMGFNKAPAYARNPPWVNKIRWMAQSQGLEGVTPYANAQKDNAIYEAHLKELYQQEAATGKPNGFNTAWARFIHDYGLSKKSAEAEMKRLAAPIYASTLQHLPIEDQVILWNEATPEQRQQYLHFFNIRVSSQLPGQATVPPTPATSGSAD